MNVRFDQIPEQGFTLEVTDESWFPDDELVRDGGVRADLFLTIRRNRVRVEGSIAVRIVHGCDRCLEEYAEELKTGFSLIVELLSPDDPLLRKDEHACTADDLGVQYVTEPEIDVPQLLRQQVFLALPVKRLCSDECLGLCARCGRNLNRNECTCSGSDVDSPFAVLAQLK